MCTRCKQRDDKCTWPENRNVVLAAKKSKHMELEKPKADKPDKPEPAMAAVEKDPFSLEKMKIGFLDDSDPSLPPHVVVQDLKFFRDDLTSFQMELEGLKTGDSFDGYDIPELEPMPGFSPPTPALRMPFLALLDEEGLLFLDYYCENYCTFVSIGLDSLNYFLNTFGQIAAANEGVLYAITAWGGFFTEAHKPKSDFTRPWTYMQLAAKHMCKQIGNDLQATTKEQFFALFAFYLIFMGIEVCTGDIRNWRGILRQSAQLINSFGGLPEICRLFDHSNDIKWMISDFEFHDLLSLGCLLHGPAFPMEEYRDALNPTVSYGLDPLQGIVGPAYEIIGDIGTVNAELLKKWAELEPKLVANEAGSRELRQQHYAEVQTAIDTLAAKIDACTPLAIHLQLLEGHADRKLHMALFDLHIYVCRMQLASSIERIPPNTVSQQRLLLDALPVLDSLLGTKLKVALAMLMLVCGMTCCTPYDREAMVKRFRLHTKQYQIGNMRRIEEMVFELWEQNADGSVCLSWPELAAAKLWQLYVG